MKQLYSKILDIDAEIDKHRHESCKSYDDCLMRAAIMDWRSFSCEDCTDYVERELIVEMVSSTDGRAYPDASGPPIGPEDRKRTAQAMRKLGVMMPGDHGGFCRGRVI